MRADERHEVLVARGEIDIDAWGGACLGRPHARVRQGCHVGQQ
jgi:hypothetical protein